MSSGLCVLLLVALVVSLSNCGVCLSVSACIAQLYMYMYTCTFVWLPVCACVWKRVSVHLCELHARVHSYFDSWSERCAPTSLAPPSAPSLSFSSSTCNQIFSVLLDSPLCWRLFLPQSLKHPSIDRKVAILTTSRITFPSFCSHTTNCWHSLQLDVWSRSTNCCCNV